MLASDLKTGVIFTHNNEPYVVEKYKHTQVARGGASVKVKARNIITSQVSDFNYKSNDKVEDAHMTRQNSQYIYESNGYVFMNPETYAQFTLKEELLAEKSKYLIEGETYQVLYFEGKPVSVEFPNSLVFTVTYTEPGHKGNTVSTVYKDATLDDKFEAKVHSFIKIGDKVKIDTRSGEYMSKA